MSKVKEYLELLAKTFDCGETLNRRQAEYNAIVETIFPERIQPTQGFFKRKPTDFIAPTNWGEYDPCTVTIFRNAEVNCWDDNITNFGTDEDIKTFYCPHFNENIPCKHNCRYQIKNNKYFEIQKLIDAAQQSYDDTVAKRHMAWKQIFKLR